MTSWLRSDELRIGLGCMRLEGDARATLRAAVAAGITVFDTARAYEGSEELLARALRGAPGVRVVTKGGMARPGGAWVPDGRAKSIRTDCEASLAALDGLPIDLFLLHAPDPRTPWRTSLRALARLEDDGLVARIGVANVNRDQLDEALELAPISAVQVALSPFDDDALRSGVFDRCLERGLALIAHSPLGGPRRVGRLARYDVLGRVAGAHDASPAEIALAWLLALGPNVIAIPGARRPVTVRSAASAADVALTEQERDELDESLGRARRESAARGARVGSTEVVLVMGIPGAGKSRVAGDYVSRGYARLNRDERGGTLRDLATELDSVLAAGTAAGVVLDNTYLTRSARSHVVDTARRHGATVRCVWLDTPLAQAQVNLVERLLERLGSLPTPEELKELARTVAGVLTPTSQMRAFRELEPPTEDEGFAAVERIAFTREPDPERTGSGVLVAAPAIGRDGFVDALAADPTAAHLVFDWRPEARLAVLDEAIATLRSAVAGSVEAAVCTHPGGPPVCWCRPPLPGLALAFARSHALDLSISLVIGASPAHRTLANALGSRYLAV